MAAKPGPTPCQEMVDVWVQNVFPDIALQTIGMRLMGSAFELAPELMDPEMYVDMPGTSERWVPADLQTDKLTLHTVELTWPLEIMINPGKFQTAVAELARQIKNAVTSSELGVVRGTMRLNTRASTTPELILGGLTWLGVKR